MKLNIQAKRLSPYGLRRRAEAQRKAMKLAEELGHELSTWTFSEIFPIVSIAYCVKCHREVVCGLPLLPTVGRALKEECNIKETI